MVVKKKTQQGLLFYSLPLENGVECQFLLRLSVFVATGFIYIVSCLLGFVTIPLFGGLGASLLVALVQPYKCTTVIPSDRNHSISVLMPRSIFTLCMRMGKK